MRRQIIRLAVTGSTMDDAAGQPPGTVVVADEQTAGQGRLGRKWHSEPGAGLYFSVVLELTQPAPVITLAIGLAVREAIRSVTGVDCDLRWPNDVLVGEKKCAGILVQLRGSEFIAGIGVNVNHTSFPSGIAGTATSLRLAAGRSHSKEELLEDILDSIDAHTNLLESEGVDAILSLYTAASSYVTGRRVIVDEHEGATGGLDSSGFLWLLTDKGERRLIRSGGVRPAPGQ